MMLSRDFINLYKDMEVPWGPVGYMVYKRTYARYIEKENRKEEWYETIARCVNAICKIGIFTEDEARNLYDHVFNLRCMFGGRSLWQLGTSNVDRFGGDSLQNCWHVVVNEPVKPFCFTFNELMLGGGVGFNIQAENVYEIPVIKYKPIIKRVDSNDCDFIVPDNREGWVKLLGKVLKRFYYGGGDLTYSTNCIRARGQLIRSFGGVASGSEELVKGINLIIKILNNCYNRKLRSIDCLDIMNIIGSIVVSGNVRRSAEIALGDPWDTEYLNAKNWNLSSIPESRRMSNNSVITSIIEDLPMEFWEGYNGNGEAYGLVNLKACKTYGRICDGAGYRPDPEVAGVNPCAEITLANYEACNLAEMFLPNISDIEQFKEISGLLYRVCKSISTLPFIDKRTEAIVKKNRRIGISVSGFLQSKWKYDIDAFHTVYDHLINLDKEYSKLLGINNSIKLTCVKPSGTVSLMAGVTPGCHAAYAPYYIRRIRMSSNDPLVNICKEHGYHVEPLLDAEGQPDLKTMIVSYPTKTPEDTICANEMSATDQLESQKWLQENWADNSVSCTIYYHKEELHDIKQWLKHNYQYVKAVSFLLHSEHGFIQAPLEEITEEKYNELISIIKPIQRIEGNFEIDDSLECGKGGCPIK